MISYLKSLMRSKSSASRTLADARTVPFQPLAWNSPIRQARMDEARELRKLAEAAGRTP